MLILVKNTAKKSKGQKIFQSIVGVFFSFMIFTHISNFFKDKYIITFKQN